jgi:hypothetical protein
MQYNDEVQFYSRFTPLTPTLSLRERGFLDEHQLLFRTALATH